MAKPLHKVRRFPEMDKRMESGPIMFGDDWPGIFIRGDDAHAYTSALREVLLDKADIGLMYKRVLEGLLDALESSDARNNDAYPAWHEKQDSE